MMQDVPEHARLSRLFSIGDIVAFHDANYPRYHGKHGTVTRVGDGVLDVDFDGMDNFSILVERAELIRLVESRDISRVASGRHNP